MLNSQRSNILLFLFLAVLTSCGFHEPPLRVLPKVELQKERTLFIALDGVSYEMMKELKAEGHYAEFNEPSALITTFPSATTAGFTGIYQPLGIDKAMGYESRFFDHAQNKMVGGTLSDVYKYPIDYKYYFDAFRFTVFDKGMMYAFPGMSGKNDLLEARDLLYTSKKNVLMTYLGGTDGFQHLIGKARTKKFLIFMSRFLQGMQKEYLVKKGKKLNIVLFSDHGFHFDKMKSIPPRHIEKALEQVGLNKSKTLDDEKDVVLVEFGVISNGVMVLDPQHAEKASRAVVTIKGVDISFWPQGKKRIHMVDSLGQEAFFEYRGNSKYRYQSVKGDPLQLHRLLQVAGVEPGAWLSDKKWFDLTARHLYPDPGYRLYEAFHGLVKHPANVLFTLKPRYQYGSWPARLGTYVRFGHKGTHGALFWEPSAAMVMVNNPLVRLPKTIRYNQLFPLLLPDTVKALRHQPIQSIERSKAHGHDFH